MKRKIQGISKKLRFIIFIVIIAVMAGVYFTFRSFAYDSLPLHFNTTQFDFDSKPMPFGAEEFEYTLKPLINEHTDGVYMSTAFYFKASADSKNPEEAVGYAGLQNSKCNTKSKCVVFSIWRAINGEPAIPNSISRYFTHEGSGWQIIAPYEWSANNEYVIKVRFIGTNSSGQDQWSASIRNVKSARVTQIGTIRVPGNWWGLASSVVTFSEVFSSATPNRRCLNVPYIGAEYKNYVLRAGNTTLLPKEQSIRYDGPGRETPNCRQQSQITPIKGGVKHEMAWYINNIDTRNYQQNVIK